MMTALVGPSPQDIPSQPPEDRFVVLLVNHFKAIVEDAFRNLEYASRYAGDPREKARMEQYLKQGIWSPDDYYLTAQKIGLEPSNEKLISYRKGVLPERFFTRIKEFTFKLKEGARPSEAINYIGREWSILDSGSFYMLAFHRALSDFLGAQKYDRLFSGSRFFFFHKPNIRMTSCFFENVAIGSSEDVKVGDRCCFKNILSVVFKHKISEEHFGICHAPKSFLGQGLPLEGATRVEVEQMLLQRYNQPPLLPTSRLYAADTVTLEQFHALEEQPPYPKEGKLYLWVARPHIENITQLAEATLDTAPDVYNNMKHPPSSKKPRTDLS